LTDVFPGNKKAAGNGGFFAAKMLFFLSWREI